MSRSAPPHSDKDDQAAGGRPVGAGTTFAEVAPVLFENGFRPLPILPGTKRPSLSRWTAVPIDEQTVEHWCRTHARCGVGLRTGALVGLDIDLLDADLAHRVERVVRGRLGDTPLLRVGQWPKRLLMYRTGEPFSKMSVPGLEILGLGQQFVAFGIHPDIGQPYHWPLGETPLEVPLDALPAVTPEACQDLLAEVAAIVPQAERGSRRGGRAKARTAPPASGPLRDERGLVIDGRDSWLSTIAYHVVHDALSEGRPLDHRGLTQTVWQRFAGTTDLGRPRQGGRLPYAPHDAARKVADKLRLHAEGRLPSRDAPVVEAAYQVPTDGVAEARARLDEVLWQACDRIEAWHREPEAQVPRIGIRATVGLGKSVSARRHLLGLRERLMAMGAPSRIVVFTPSHVLAREAAAAWRAAGVTVAVLHGYEATDPASGSPMCRDIDAVRAATLGGVDVHSTACAKADRRCAFFDTCLKQRNRAEVAAADVVFAAYDALFTGFAIEPKTIAAMLIDEGCWARSMELTGGLSVETFGDDLAGGFVRQRRLSQEAAAAAMADLMELRQRAQAALRTNGPGVLRRSLLVGAGLSERECRDAAEIEERRLRDPGLYPGMPKALREQAAKWAQINRRTLAYATAWRTMADLLGGDRERDGRLRILPPDGETGLQGIAISGVKRVHRNLGGIPVVHLDATLRPALARTILPGLEVTGIDAAAPHMQVRLVTGSFGKGSLCADPRASAEENRRRWNRLRECVDYVRWHARRLAPGGVLVVTYKACQEAFSGIPGVSTAHFNAIAGLDAYRDVGLLIVVGRPLPSESDVRAMTGACLGRAPAPSAGYHHAARGVRMRDGSSRTVRVIEHEDEHVEVLRSAICDDELIQAIGRGRGVNRTTENPLDVHVLADVALPLVHDRVLAWETVVPDVIQRMLLAGVALDSPADAAALHPGLFAGENQAKKAFQKSAFKGQNPISNIYREMTLKSAAYRRAGKGRSWQRVWWLEGDAEPTRQRVEDAVGPLSEWREEQP